MHLEKEMIWKVLHHVFVPSSGLEENNIKGAFYPVVPYIYIYIYIYISGVKISALTQEIIFFRLTR